jgi:hypothetical protein
MKSKYIYPAIFVVLIIWAIALAVLVYKLETKTENTPKNSNNLTSEQLSTELKDSIILGANWFEKIQKENGDFIYQFDTATATESSENNIVRQAGSLYALAQSYDQTKDPKTEEVFKKGIEYFKDLLVEKGEDKNAVEYESTIKSNTTALLILALVEYAESKESTDFELITKLSNYLVSTQTTDGDYINEYTTPDPVISDYNNGETMHALIRSYTLTKDPEYLTSVKKAAEYFKQTYGNQDFNASFFSWGMAGFSYLYKESSDESDWNFLKNYYAKYQVSRGNNSDTCASNNTDGCIKPSLAVFLEGVTHIGWVAKEKDSNLYETIKAHLDLTLPYLLRYQIGGDKSKFSFTDELLQGSVCGDSECTYTRIDFTQHQMSANYLYLKFI